MIIAFLILIPPRITGEIVDHLVTHTLTANFLIVKVLQIVMVAIAIYFLRFLWRISLYGASYRLASYLRSRIYQHLTLMAPSFFRQYPAGDLMSRVTSDVSAIEMTAGEGVLSLVDGAMTGIVVLSMLLFFVSWKLTLVALLPWPFMAYAMWQFGRSLHSRFAVSQAALGSLTRFVEETLSGIRMVKAFGLEVQKTEAFAEVVVAASSANRAVSQIDAKYEPTIFLTIALSFLLATLGGAWLIHKGELTLGALTSFSMYLSYLIWPMFAFGWVLNIIERGNVAFLRVQTLLNTLPEIKDEGKKTTMTDSVIRFDIERFAYGVEAPSKVVLEDVRFEIAVGSFLGITGPTGSGKSTLIALLLRREEAVDARVFLGGEEIRVYPLQLLRDAIACVTQEPFLFSVSIAENIALGKPTASLDEIKKAAEMAAIHDDIEAFNDQYHTLVGEKGVTLSGGQKQRISIARAILMNAPILILDNALSAVDIETERRVLLNLKQYRKNRTMIVISHRLSSLEYADNILVLSSGRVIEHGKHAELRKLNGWYERIYQYQQLERQVEAGT